MIKKWGVKNFKSILDADLELAPLTVFTGVNSSGKSSFLHSIVMLAQAAKSRVEEAEEYDEAVKALLKNNLDAENDTKDIDERIPLKGRLLDLGSYNRIHKSNSVGYQNGEEEFIFGGEIGITFTIIPSKKYEYVSLKLGLSGSKEDEKLTVLQAFMECKEKEGDSSYIKCKKNDYYLNDTSKSASDAFDEMWRRTEADHNPTAVFKRINDSVEVEIRKVCLDSFIPFYMRYSIPFYTFNSLLYLDSASLKKIIPVFTGLLSDIPVRQLTTKNNAIKYAGEKFEERSKMDPFGLRVSMRSGEGYEIMNMKSGERGYKIDSPGFGEFRYKIEDPFSVEREFKIESSGFGIEKYDIVKHLFYICTNNLWWLDYSIVENDKSKAMFSKIPYFEKLFSEFKKINSNGSEYYDIELSDWYQVLSKQETHIQEAIKNGLNNDSEFSDALADNIETFRKRFGILGFSSQLGGAHDHLSDYFRRKIKYLGPLREDPKWDYKKKEDDKEIYGELISEYKSRMPDVGVKGERTPFVADYLMRTYYKIKNYYSPDFFETQDYQPAKEISFSDGLEEWIKYINISDKFGIKELKKADSFEIYMVINNQKFALPQLGTGVSQVIPILVMCLAAPPDSTIIIEQPELHLHPKMQSRLADFFIAMSLSGRQCLIETHSENIIKQLRYRIVMLSDRIPLHKKTRIYFVSKYNGVSQFKNIEVNEYAALDEWPEDFFDESSNISKKIMEEVIKKMESDEKDD